jgi:glycosyltransferase involved in cell wall biosynthesis
MSAAPPPDILVLDHAAALAVNRRLYVALARRGFRVEVATARSLWHLPGNRPAEPAAADDPPLRLLDFAGRNLRYPRVAGLGPLLAARRPRLLHLNNEPDTPLAFRLAGRQHAAGGYLTALSLESEFEPFWPALLGGRARPAARHLRTRLSALATHRRIDRLFCHSRQIERAWQELGFAGRTTVVPLGFEPALFHPDAARRAATRARLGLTQPTVAYVGRMARQKGVDLLVEALGRLTGRPWQLLMNQFLPDGTGYGEAVMARLAALGLADRVVAFQARHAEVPDYLRAADIVAVPSRWEEQYGRVAAEAMACGTAVVVSRRGALPEIVGEAGLTVPSDDAAALAAALAGLLDEPARRRALAAEGAARALATLSLERQADLMAADFRRLLDRPLR